MNEPLLEGLRVLDLADESGYLCGKTLADLGADVVKVEPIEGDRGRRVGPFAEDQPELERSLTWLAGNVNKRGITCNLESASGRDLFRRLVARVDVVIETFRPGRLEALGLDYESLSAGNPGLIMTSITPFGLDGPRADWRASDIEVNAASGSVWLAGDPKGFPVRNTLPQTPNWASMSAAMGTLVAVLARETTGGRGQRVDVSAQASMLMAISHAPIFWDLLRENPMRSGPNLSGRSVTGAEFCNLWPCKDGFVTFALYGGAAGRNTSKALLRWMQERGAPAEAMARVDWDSFDVALVTPAQVAELEAEIRPFLLTLTKKEFFAGVVQRNMLGYPVATVEDIWNDEQLKAREFWQQVPTPWGGDSIPFPGTLALFDGARPPIVRTAPRLGEHNVEIYSGELGISPESLAALRGAGAL